MQIINTYLLWVKKYADKEWNGPLPEYDINEAGIMVLCKACDIHLELLSGNKNIDSIIADERKNERIMI